ncbi:hypothetical protein [Agrobacterium rosae]|uniref:hypothetical protein n=1 Tax=Agrobacterium rosae TaxID=1972867 RepID=UPI0011B7740D|nr:hypothetical protein [Agrobacterium rosae]
MVGRSIPVHPGKLPSAEELANLVREGHGSNQIAERFGVTGDHTRKRLKDLGLTPPKDSQPRPRSARRVMQLHGQHGPISLPRVSMLTDMEKYA